MPSDPSSDLVPIRQAAELLHVSVDTIRRWEKEGVIHAQRSSGGHRLFSRQQIEDYQNSRPLKISEAAAALHLSTSTIRRHEQRGIIASQMDNRGRRLYTRESLEHYRQVITAGTDSLYNSTVPSSTPKPIAPIAAVEKPVLNVSAPDQTKIVFAAPQKRQHPSSRSADYLLSRFGVLKQHHKVLAAAIVFIALAGALISFLRIPARTDHSDQWSDLAQLQSTKQRAVQSAVLGLTKSQFDRYFEVNVPAFFSDGLYANHATISGTLIVEGKIEALGVDLDLGEGAITAANLRNLVNSVQGETGDINLSAGEGIAIEGLTISSLAQAVAAGHQYIGDVTGSLSDGDYTALSIAGNSVALATDTTGKYVATIDDAGNSTVTVNNSGTEKAAVSLDVIDVNCTDCLSAKEIEDIYLYNTGDMIAGDFSPDRDSHYNLGSGDFRWHSLYVSTINAEGNITPNDNAAYDIGSAVRVWNNIYANSIEATTTAFNGIAYTWPGTAGSNGQVLTTSGSGALTWETAAGTLSGSGTANYLAMWTNGTALGNSLLQQNGIALLSGGDFLPTTTNAYALGSPTLQWEGLYVGSITAGGHIVPTTDSTYDLGTSALSWANAYVDTLFASAAIGINQTSPEAQLHIGASDFVVTGDGEVGIGTTSPVSKLDVRGNITINGAAGTRGLLEIKQNGTPDASSGLTLTDSGVNYSARWWIGADGVQHIYNGATGTSIIALGENGAKVGVGYDSTSLINGTGALLINGNVGIGTTLPTSFKLQVAGNIGPDIDSAYDLGSSTLRWEGIYADSINAAGAISPATDSTYDLGTSALSWANAYVDTLFASAAIGINQTSPEAQLHIGASDFVVTGDGEVGIGTTAPGAKLEVSGNMYLSTGASRTIQVADTADGSGYNLTVRSGNSGGTSNLVGSNLTLSAGNTAGLEAGGKVYIYGGLGSRDQCFGVCSGGANGDVILAHNGSSYRGNVAIGTNSPGARLHVLESGSYALSFGAGTAYTSQFINQATRSSGSDPLTNVALYTSATGGQNNYAAIFENGNVGIGTTVPGYNLHVVGDAGIGGTLSPLADSSYDIGTAALRWDALYVGSINAEGNIVPTYTGNYDLGSSALHWNSLYVDSITAYGSITPGTDSTYDLGTSALAWANAYINTVSINGLIAQDSTGIRIQDDGGNLALYVQDGGNVGIGTTTPSAPLHVVSTTSAGVLTVQTSTSTTFISLKNTTAAGHNWQMWSAGTGSVYGASKFILHDETAGAARITVDSSGNVGIGTVDPSSFKLQVAGNIGPNIDSAYDLGSSTLRWEGIYADSINAAGAISPSTDSTYNLGSSSLYWANAYIDTATISGAIGINQTSPEAQLHIGASDFVVTGDGKVGIGTTAPGAQLDLSTDSARKLTTTTWATGSDSRIKTEIESIKDALEIIRRVRPVKFHYTAEFLSAHPSVTDTDYYNFIAQEYQEVFPDSVTETDGTLFLNSSNMIPYAIAGIKAIDSKLADKAENSTLGLTIDQLLPSTDAFQETSTKLTVLANQIADYASSTTALAERLSALEEAPAPISSDNPSPDNLLSLANYGLQFLAATDELRLSKDLVATQNLVLYGTLIADTADIASSLNIHGDATVWNNLLVKANLAIEGDLQVGGVLGVNSRQAGQAAIPRGGITVEVTYSEPFTIAPLVQITPQAKVDTQFWISQQTATGFAISLTQPTEAGITFSWMAMPVDNIATTQGQPLDTDGDGIIDIDETAPNDFTPAELPSEPVPVIEEPTPVPTPSFSPSPTLIPATPTTEPISAITPTPSQLLPPQYLP